MFLSAQRETYVNAQPARRLGVFVSVRWDPRGILSSKTFFEDHFRRFGRDKKKADSQKGRHHTLDRDDLTNVLP